MKTQAKLLFWGLALLVLACGKPPTFEVPETAGMRWFKGNTHAHTNNSDGDSPPEYVARWYKEHGYHFLVLSDHNVLTNPQIVAHLVDSSFIVIPGEEVSSGFNKKPVHVNGLNISHRVEPRVDSSMVATIQANVDAVREADGVPHINHPNFLWAFSHRELLQIRNDRLLEIYNGHPLVNNWGGGGWPGMEQVWDHLLTAGKRIYGIAVDDAHDFQGEFSPRASNPGRGWVMVRAHRLDPLEIVQNLEKGLFYASTGVVLEDVIVTPQRMEIRIHPQWDFKYRTQFIGDGGQILYESVDNPAVFELTQKTSYVRAKVMSSGGFVAWVQPVFTR